MNGPPQPPPPNDRPSVVQRHGDFMAGLAEGCQVLSPDWVYLYVNAAAAAQGRREIGQLIGRRITDVYPGIEFTAMFASLRTCMAERAPQHLENEFHYPDGSTAWFELRIEPVPEGIFILSVDITDRRRAVEDRLRLSIAIEQAAEAVIMTDARGTIQYVNPAFERITGYPRDEAIGQNPRMLKSGEQDGRFYREMWLALHAGSTWHGRFTNRRKDGTTYTQDTTISPVFDANGTLVSFVGVSRDVTKELRLEADLLQAQKMETIGRLAGGIAHDFNNLLSVIVAYADVAMASLPADHPLHPDIQSIRQAGDRAASLTSQLLAFSRKQMLQPELLDLNAVVGGMEPMLRRIIGEDIDLVVSLHDQLGNVRADPRQLEQVLLNLVVNARDAMPHGGRLTIGTANVDLDAEYARGHVDVTPGPFVMLGVSDTGTGMSEEVRSRVFEPFFTTKPPGVGTGLGLATAYGIVKQSGGHIWVYSEPGRGTTFKVYLPLDPSGEAVRRPKLARRAAQPSGGGETILLVEDEQAVRRIGERILMAAGYVVHTAANGREALAICDRLGSPVDLLLTDLVMPQMSGIDLAHKIRERWPGTRVLFMSGYTDDAIAHHGILEPGSHFIGKPFNIHSLQQRVREVLDS